jgi:hypothetical protein
MNAISIFLNQLKGLIREELGKDKRLQELERDLGLSRFGSSEEDPVFGASTAEGVARLRKERSDCQNAMYQVVERFLRAPP